MGKKNRFKKISREVGPGRKLEQSPTLILDEEAQNIRFARNQWYRYFVQIESQFSMVTQDEKISMAQQSLMMLGRPLGIDPDSELGRKMEQDRRLEEQERETTMTRVRTGFRSRRSRQEK